MPKAEDIQKSNFTIASEYKRRIDGRLDWKRKKNLDNGFCFDCEIQIKIGDTSIDYSEKKDVHFPTDR